jgi:thiol-disulfide isomerase/thioredoxin
MKLTHLLLTALLALLLFPQPLLAKDEAAAAKAKAGAVVGEPAPQPLGLGPDGEPLTVAQYQGKLLVVSFWASWCGPCLNELPVLDAIQRKVGTKQLAVVAVNIEERDTYRRIRRQLGNKLALTLAHDHGERALPAWGEGGIPYLLFIDPAGRVHAKYRGYGESTLSQIVADLNELLAAQAAALRSAEGG